MKNINVPVGISNFEKIRQDGYYYVDKTGLIKDMLKNKIPEVTLITRPRRFGKTLAMSMLASFFDIRRDSKKLFQGLNISKEQQLCNDWMNQYPTLFLSFKDVDGTIFENALGLLQFTIAELCKKHTYLIESDLVAEAVAYMRLHFARPLKLTKVARHVGCSPAYLSRKFQAERSCTFTYCLNQIRVEQSKPLLLNPALTVGDVGYLVGFCEQSYFVKVFRRYTGMTPRQYQQSEKRGLSP